MNRCFNILFCFAFTSFLHAQCPVHVSISSDTALTNFLANYPSCLNIEGDLTLSGTSLTSLAGLENITHVGGNVSIHHTGLNNLNGLNGLVTVDSTIRIFRNDFLFSVDGINALQNVGGGLVLSKNAALQNTDGLIGLHSVGDFLRIVDNDQLNDVSGFDSLSAVQGIISFRDNDQSFPFDGFNHIQEPVSRIRFTDNGVSGVNGFNSIPQVTTSVRILNNHASSAVVGFNNITHIGESLLYFDKNLNVDTFSGFQNLSQIDNTLYVLGGGTRFSLSALQEVEKILLNGQINQVQLPSLEAVGDFMSFYELTLSLNDSLLFTNLHSIGGNLKLHSVSNANLIFPELTTIGGFFLASGVNMKYVKMPVLASVGDYLQFNSVSILNSDSFYFPSLVHIENDFNFYNNNASKVCLPLLSDVGGINFSNANFTTFSAPLIDKCDNLTFNNSNLFDFDLSSLDTIYETIYINGNDSLLSLDGLSNLEYVGQTIQITYNYSLSDCSVYAICNKIIASPNLTIIGQNKGNCYNLTKVALSCYFCEGGVSGNVFFDIDCNGIKDSTDVYANAISVKGYNDSFYTLTDSAGSYALDFTSFPQFKLFPEVIEGYQSVPEFVILYPGLDTVNYNSIDFRYCPDGIVHDVKVSLIPFKAAEPNSLQLYKISLGNIGNQTEDIALRYHIPRNYNGEYYNVADADGGLMLGDSMIFWSFEQVYPMQHKYLTVGVDLGIDLQVDSSIFSSVEVSLDPEITDANVKDNIDSLTEKVTAATHSFHKIGSPEALVTGLNSLNDLEYTIYFQNTGPAPINAVAIVDTLDFQLWNADLEMISASHNYELYTLPNGILRWEFNDINLPDSASNLQESFGFVHFAMKSIYLSSYLTTIENAAYIYFDDSTANTTDTVVTEVLSHLPITSSLVKTGNEDEMIYFNGMVDFPAIDQAFPFTGVKLLSLPIKGNLFFNNTPVVLNQIVPFDSISYLTFMPFTNEFSAVGFYASIQFKAMNQYGLSSQRYISIKILPINDRPITQDKAFTINHDDVYTFSYTNFKYTDVESIGSYGIHIKTLPANGGLYINGDLVLVAPLTIASTEVNWLTFIPSSGLSGTQTSAFEFTVSDPQGLESLPSTITFTILDSTSHSNAQPRGWNLQVSPNPANDRVSFKGNLPACPISVQLFDISGSLLGCYEFGAEEIAQSTISLAFLPTGNYQLKVICNEQFHVFRIVKI